jgi:integrase
MSLDAAIEELNSRLRAGHYRCSVEQRKASLVLRATLVDRSDPSKARRQRISLGLPATYGSLAEAEEKAHKLGRQIRTNSFSWDLWDSPEAAASTLTVDDFRAAAERLHATKYRQSPERGREAWTKKWRPALNKLPPSGAITEATLVRVINRMPAGTAGRRDQGNLLAQIAKSCGLNPETVQAAARGYGVAALTPRDIPTDADIEAAWHCLKQPHWKWTWGMCAAYGLRPHEVIGIEWLNDNWIRIADATKTGTRQVTPCPSAWVKTFALRNLPEPTQTPHTLAKVFGDALDRAGITIKPYNLRHAYALRLMDNSIPPELGARLMGHSLQVHLQTYQRWIEADRIQRALTAFSL